MVNYAEKYVDVVKHLPNYCIEYFSGLHNRLSLKSAHGYAMDLRVFFHYLVTEHSALLSSTDIKDVPIDILNQLQPIDIKNYMSFLRHYEIGNKIYNNGPSGINRKLSSLKKFFRYLNQSGKIQNDPCIYLSGPASLPNTSRADYKHLKRDTKALMDEIRQGTNKSNRQRSFHKYTKHRDQAILALLTEKNLSVRQILELNLDDFDRVSQMLYVMKSNNNVSAEPLNQGIFEIISDYLSYERPYLSGPPKESQEIEPLFLSLRHNRISVQRVEELRKEYLKN